MVIAPLLVRSADSRRDDERRVAKFRTQPRGFLAGANEAVHPGGDGFASAEGDEFLHRAAPAEFGDVARVHACEHRHGEQLHVAFHWHRSGVDRRHAVQRATRRAAAGQVCHRAPHRRRNVVKFDVGKDFLPASTQLFQQLEVAPAHAKFEAQFIKRHRVPEPIHPSAGVLNRRNVEGKNESVARVDLFRHCVASLPKARRMRNALCAFAREARAAERAA